MQTLTLDDHRIMDITAIKAWFHVKIKLF